MEERGRDGLYSWTPEHCTVTGGDLTLGVGYSVPVVEGSLLEGLISLYLTSTELVAVTFLISVSHKLFSRAQCGLTTFYGDIPGGSGKSRLAVLEYSST